MRLLVCAYEDVDAERVLVDELSDLDDAVACCRDLVESEGYPRAEVWNAVGRCLFVVVLDGNAIYESDAPDEATLLEPPAPLHEPHVTRGYPPAARPRSAPHPDPRPTTNGERPDGDPTAPPPALPGPGVPPGLLGEQPGSDERWFGL